MGSVYVLVEEAWRIKGCSRCRCLMNRKRRIIRRRGGRIRITCFSVGDDDDDDGLYVVVRRMICCECKWNLLLLGVSMLL